ncbi:class I SAM-dependent methyltransferase [Nocardiopsis sp. RSe5-2]|uniref:Class I SAM-dependent methyltransferase n=1 Tax=Nocardiopsis endophytica TaxID=3018445 RepID=A0ABT4UEC2_9ACTN|nr:class I SAM-dependent methyltransferase [Nocardiopsis endophytica]MDA2814819.1 class I SAM-dependent methyltransferase [Nocardiopsis endophytica]
MPTHSHGTAPHQHRRTAESFGVDPERYDRTRRRYPRALIDRIAAASPGPRVLDAGCGTGIAARQFRDVGREVLGVEPDARMAEFARSTGIDVETARFEDWDPAGRTFDALVSGQAWHWIDPVEGAVRAARALRGGGVLSVFWHAVHPPSAVTEAFADAFERAVPDAPFDVRALDKGSAGYDTFLAPAEEGMEAAGAFSAPERWRFDWECPYTRDEWLDQLPTHGALTRLPAETREGILRRVGDAIDALGGEFTVRYSTVATTARAVAAPGAPHGAPADPPLSA